MKATSQISPLATTPNPAYGTRVDINSDNCDYDYVDTEIHNPLDQDSEEKTQMSHNSYTEVAA